MLKILNSIFEFASDFDNNSYYLLESKMFRSKVICASADKTNLRKDLEEEMRAQMLENEREQEEMKKSYEEKLRAAKAAAAASGGVSTFDIL